MPVRYTLSPKEERFCRLYALGPPELRGNAVACYRASGYTATTEGSAGAGSARLLKKVKARDRIAQLHRESEAEVIRQLVDWKLYAAEAQQRVRQIELGYIPDTDDSGPVPRATVRRIRTAADASVAAVLLKAADMILERAYPSKIYAELALRDPDGVLSLMLGISREELPQPLQPPHSPLLLPEGNTHAEDPDPNAA